MVWVLSVKETVLGVALGILIGTSGYLTYHEYLRRDGQLLPDMARASSVRAGLQRVAEQINREQPIDTFYVFLLHEAPWEWKNGDFAAVTPYASAVYFWVAPGVRNPIANRQLLPLTGFGHVHETVEGICASEGYDNGGDDLIDNPDTVNRIIVTCPLQRDGETYGFIGSAKIDASPNDVDDRLALLRRYIRVVQDILNGRPGR